MTRVIIDVREPEEFATGHIDGAINLPPADLLAGAKQIDHISKNEEIILYCVSGARSNASMNLLREMGYTNLTNGINKDHIAKKYGLEIVNS